MYGTQHLMVLENTLICLSSNIRKDLIFTFILKLLEFLSDYESNMFIVENVENAQKCKDKNKINHNCTTER